MGRKTKESPGIKQKNGPNIWGALQNVIITSMNKGQFIALAWTALLMQMVWKMPSEDVSMLVFRLADMVERGELVSYLLSLLLCALWFLHVRRLKRVFYFEMERVANEKTDLQRKLLPSLIESSENAMSKSREKEE